MGIPKDLEGNERPVERSACGMMLSWLSLSCFRRFRRRLLVRSLAVILSSFFFVKQTRSPPILSHSTHERMYVSGDPIKNAGRSTLYGRNTMLVVQYIPDLQFSLSSRTKNQHQLILQFATHILSCMLIMPIFLYPRATIYTDTPSIPY